MANDIVVRDGKELAGLLKKPAFIERVTPFIPRSRLLDKYVSGILSAAAKNPRIYQCTKESVMKCAVSLFELNLATGTAMPEAHIVPYGNQATLIADYRGLVKIACRSGKVKSITSYCVGKGDKFSIKLGSAPGIEHEPSTLGSTHEGNMVGVYAIAYFADGSHQSEWMTKGEINNIRDRSRAKSSGPWVTDYTEMARKTVTRRLCKRLPLADEDRLDLNQVLEAEDHAEGLITVEATAIDDSKSRTQALADKLKPPTQEPDERYIPAESHDQSADHQVEDDIPFGGEAEPEPRQVEYPSAKLEFCKEAEDGVIVQTEASIKLTKRSKKCITVILYDGPHEASCWYFHDNLPEWAVKDARVRVTNMKAKNIGDSLWWTIERWEPMGD